MDAVKRHRFSQAVGEGNGNPELISEISNELPTVPERPLKNPLSDNAISKQPIPVFNCDPADLQNQINDSWYPDDLKEPVIQKWVKAVERFTFTKGDRDHCLKIIVDDYWDTFDSEGQLDLVNMIWGFWMSCELPHGKAWHNPIDVVDKNGRILTRRPFT